MTDNELIFGNLLKIVKSASFARMQSVLDSEQIESSNEKFPHLMPGEWVSLILLSSNQVRIFFKIFFDFQTLHNILNEKKILQKILRMDESTLTDFMKEYCNLVGGYINAILEQNEIQTSMSLPLALKGFEDFFFPYPDNVGSFESNWVIDCQGQKFYCACLVEIMDFKSLEIFKDFTHELVDLKEGDVHFL